MAMTSNWIPNIKKAWKGEEDFWKIFWFFGVLGGIVVSFIWPLYKMLNVTFPYFYSFFIITSIYNIIFLKLCFRSKKKKYSEKILYYIQLPLNIISFHLCVFFSIGIVGYGVGFVDRSVFVLMVLSIFFITYIFYCKTFTHYQKIKKTLNS